MCADAPDTSGMNEAAKGNLELGREALAWYKEQYQDQMPMRQRAADTAEAVSQSQLRAMDTQTGLAKDYADYSKATFRPVEESIVKDAMEFDTDAKREELAGLARGDNAQAFAGARSQMRRDIGRAGVNPADGAFSSGLADLASREALGDAHLRNKARTDATALGRAMKMDAAGLGRGLASNQATAQQIALSAGNSAVGNAQTGFNMAQQAQQGMGQGFQTGMQGNTSAGNIYGNIANIQNGDGGAGLAAGAGSAIGGIAMAI